MQGFSIEDLATLGDEQALRRRFDAHNLRVLRRMLWGFVPVYVAQLASAMSGPEAHRTFRLLLTLLGVSLVGVLVPVLRRVSRGVSPDGSGLLEAAARRVNRSPRAVVLGFLVAQFLLVVSFAFHGEREPWFFVYGLLLLFYRFAAAEVVALYVSILLTAFVVTVVDALQGGVGFEGEFLVPAGIVNAILLVVALVVGRRARRTFLAGWREEQTRAREQIRMRQELEMARRVQVSMLPDQDPSPGWLDVAGVSLPATEVGGDYYDYVTTASGQLAVVVGDVAGHGLASGLVLSGVRSCLVLLAEELDRPSVVLRKLHGMLRATARHRMFVTLSILLLDRERFRAVLASAGHPPLLIRRAAGGVEEVLLASLPLGSALPADFEEREIELHGDDVLVLHTDGVYESVDASGAAYGIPRLAQVLERSGHGTATEIRDEILRDLAAFRGSVPQGDDVTLVVVRVLSEG